MKLTELERAVLVFEASWRPEPGGPSRAAAVRERFNLGYGSYMTILRQACTKPEAQKVAPAVVNRQKSATHLLQRRRWLGQAES